MSMHQIKGDFEFECDDCHTVLETRQANFGAADNLRSRSRWRAYPKPQGNLVGRPQQQDWQHQCLECQSHDQAKAYRSRQ